MSIKKLHIIVIILIVSIHGVFAQQFPEIKTEKEFLTFLNDREFRDSYPNTLQYLEFINATEKQFGQHKSNTLIEIEYQLAQINFDYGEAYNAYRYINKVDDLLEEHKNTASLTFLTEYYFLKGTLYYRFNQLEKAKHSLHKALEKKSEKETTNIKINNTLGVILVAEKKYDSALVYYERSLHIAKTTNSEEWIGIINGNLGHIHFLNGDYENAKMLLEKDKGSSLKNNQPESALTASTMLFRIALIESNTHKIKEELNLMDSLIFLVGDLAAKVYYHETVSSYYEQKGDAKSALKHFKEGSSYRKEREEKFNATNLENLMFQIDFEREKNESSLLLEQEKRKKQLFLTITVILTILTLTSIFSIIILRRSKEQQRQLLQIKNERIKEELERNQHEMKSLLSSLIDKNEQIQSLSEKIDEQSKEIKLEELNEQILSSTLLTKNDLDRFNDLFDKIHPEFRTSIIEKFPDLTNAELRYSMLLRLNLSRNEMSKILGISEESVRKTDQRVRKKVEINTSNELLTFLNEF